MTLPTKYAFADEAGCLAFIRKPNVSRYFILCSVVISDCEIGAELQHLQRKLAWKGLQVGDYFHASVDRQEVRDAVFQLLQSADFTVQATILEKSKAHPRLRMTGPQFYHHAWFYHFRHGLSSALSSSDRVLVTAASIGTKREKRSFEEAMRDGVGRTLSDATWRPRFAPAAADPCLQIADYCAWAIQRNWERGDQRSYQIIKDRVIYENDLWSSSTTHHY